MGTRDEPPPLVEPVPVNTVFLNGLIVEDVGDDCFIITGYSLHRAPIDGTLERKIESRTAMTRAAILKGMYDVAKAIGFALAGELEANSDEKRLARKH